MPTDPMRLMKLPVHHAMYTSIMLCLLLEMSTLDVTTVFE